MDAFADGWRRRIEGRGVTTLGTMITVVALKKDQRVVVSAETPQSLDRLRHQTGGAQRLRAVARGLVVSARFVQHEGCMRQDDVNVDVVPAFRTAGLLFEELPKEGYREPLVEGAARGRRNVRSNSNSTALGRKIASGMATKASRKGSQATKMSWASSPRVLCSISLPDSGLFISRPPSKVPEPVAGGAGRYAKLTACFSGSSRTKTTR